MSHLLLMIVAFGAGAALGVFYFAGLWATVQRLSGARRPYAFLYGSFVARLALLSIGFGLLLNGGGAALAASLTGFFLARAILLRRLAIKG